MSPILPSIGTRMGPGWGHFLQRAPYAGERFGDVLADQVRFRLVRRGATGIADVRPDSAAARELWEQPTTRRFVQGVLDLAGSISGRGQGNLRGFTLSRDEAGYVANRAVHHFRAGTPASDAYEAALQAAAAHTEQTAAVRKGGWLHLDPARSAGLLHVLEHPGAGLEQLPPALRDSLGRGVKSLLHELNHVESPRPANATDLAWLSEGSAETLARWPGRVRQAGDALGVDVPPRVADWFERERAPYQAEVEAVRELLRLSGVDPTRASDFRPAERLLNATPEDELPRLLARRIADRHVRSSAERAALARSIERLIRHEVAPSGARADPAPILRLSRELARGDHDAGRARAD